MRTRYSVFACLAMLLCLCGGGAHAQSLSASGTNNSMELGRLITQLGQLQQQLNANNAAVQKIQACLNKHTLYAPSDQKADGQGCVAVQDARIGALAKGGTCTSDGKVITCQKPVTPPTGSTSCSLPWGGQVADGQSATAYQAGTVPSGSSCVSQARTCSKGTLSGSYTYGSCSVAAAVVPACPAMRSCDICYTGCASMLGKAGDPAQCRALCSPPTCCYN